MGTLSTHPVQYLPEESTMKVVVALGGNALLRRGEEMTSENQRENVSLACDELAPIASAHELVVSHGNGPQVGLLALQGAAYGRVPTYPLDILGAETQGMIGYLVEQELGNRLPFEKPLATLLTMIEVDPDDPAFLDPTKPIGPLYDRAEAEELERERGWTFRPDGDAYRRVVPSPKPKRIFEMRQIKWLLEHGCVVVCAGGGGIPTMYRPGRVLVGVEAVIDKDHASGLLARDVEADFFVMATDVEGVYVDFKKPTQRVIARAHPDALMTYESELPVGSMLPKVVAACDFARSSGKRAAIGALKDIEEMLAGQAGTIVTTEIEGIEFRSA
jgi:carbamate kinase